MKLVIDRSRWCRGLRSTLPVQLDAVIDPLDVQLLRFDGKRCCLGFFAQVCGIEDDAIEGHGEPANVDTDVSVTADPLWMRMLVETTDEDEEDLPGTFENSTLASALIEANDRDGYAEPEREARIAEMFATIGVEVEFVDG
jgi:hypothetical protein